MTALRETGAAVAPVAGRRRPGFVAWLLAAGGVLAQVAFPLTGGGTLALTIAAVALLAGASLAHAASRHGVRAGAALLLVAGVGGWVAEAVGTHTGRPFGAYAYTGTLGPQLLDVPLLVPLAWVMMAWPALCVARRLTRPLTRARGLATALVGAWALTAWDVFLDPQMVDAGHWRWADPHPALPGVAGIPVSNFAGWLLVSLLMVAVLDRVVPRPRPDDHGHLRGGPGDDGVPVAVYLWTYASSVMAHAVFFGRPSVALAGALLMGVVGVPLAVGVGHELRGRAR